MYIPILLNGYFVLCLLQRIPSKGPKAFDLFVDSLKDSGDEESVHSELAKLLTQQLNKQLNSS